MARFIKSKKEAIGISPDAMMFLGDKKSNSIGLRIIDFNAESINEYNLNSIDDFSNYDSPTSTTWLNIDGLHDEKLMRDVSVKFGIEPVAISEILDTHARPKIHDYNDFVYISLKMIQFDEDKSLVSSENLVIVIKEHTIITFQEQVGDVFNPVRERLRSNRKRIRAASPDYIAFALIDVVIDNYIYIISRVGENIENIDDELINKPSNKCLDNINHNKSEIAYLRRIVKPCRELIVNFQNLESDFINDNENSYLRSLRSNIELANESVDSYREILSDQLNVFHNSMSSRLNDILKVLTVFSVLFIPITFIVGVYGTNFDNIPELHLKYGYLYMWLLIVFVVGAMFIYFRRKKWI